MSIAFDASASGNGSGASSLTFSHTCTGSNLILFVAASVHSAITTVTGVTYNGVAMTLIDSKNGGNGTLTYLWYLIAPATGAHNVVISTGANDSIEGVSSSYSGVKQSAQPEAHGTGGPTTTTSYSQSLTSTIDGSWAIWNVVVAGGLAATAGANTTFRANQTSVYGTSIYDTNSAKTPAGTDTMNVTSASQLFFSCMAVFTAFTPSAFTATISDSMSTSDTISAIRSTSFTTLDTISTSDIISVFRGIWRNVAKNVATWINQNKS